MEKIFGNSILFRKQPVQSYLLHCFVSYSSALQKDVSSTDEYVYLEKPVVAIPEQTNINGQQPVAKKKRPPAPDPDSLEEGNIKTHICAKVAFQMRMKLVSTTVTIGGK